MISIIYSAMAFILLIDIIVYVRSMKRGETIPSRTTWSLFALIGVVAFGEQLHQNNWTFQMSILLYPAMVALSQMIVAMYSVKYGKDGKSLRDFVVIIIVAISIFIWIKDPTNALIAALVADFVAFYPTLEKTWKYPRQESLTAWILTTVLSILGVYVVYAGGGELHSFIFPGYMFFINGLLLLFITRKFFQKVKNTENFGEHFIDVANCKKPSDEVFYVKTISDSIGDGLFTRVSFKKEEPILKLTQGKIFNKETLVDPFDRRVQIQIGVNTFLSSLPGAKDNYINHSCEPSCFVYCKGTDAYIVAKRNIKENEEITIDYSINMYDSGEEIIKCGCGSSECIKEIKDFRFLSKERQKKILDEGWVPDYIIETIDNISSL